MLLPVKLVLSFMYGIEIEGAGKKPAATPGELLDVAQGVFGRTYSLSDLSLAYHELNMHLRHALPEIAALRAVVVRGVTQGTLDALTLKIIDRLGVPTIDVPVYH